MQAQVVALLHEAQRGSRDGLTGWYIVDGSVWDTHGSIIDFECSVKIRSWELPELDQTQFIAALNCLEGVKLRMGRERNYAMDQPQRGRAKGTKERSGEAQRRGETTGSGDDSMERYTYLRNYV